MSERAGRCGTCKFLIRDDEHPECHRNPPVIVLWQICKDDIKADEDVDRRSSFRRSLGVWPIVYDVDWCGEWQANGISKDREREIGELVDTAIGSDDAPQNDIMDRANRRD